MRQRLLHFGSAVILIVCIWAHVSELFDQWDNTFRTGYDVEYSTVIVVLVAGSVIAFARVLATLICNLSAGTHFRLLSSRLYTLVLPLPAMLIGHSPPPSLRI